MREYKEILPENPHTQRIRRRKKLLQYCGFLLCDIVCSTFHSVCAEVLTSFIIFSWKSSQSEEIFCTSHFMPFVCFYGEVFKYSMAAAIAATDAYCELLISQKAFKAISIENMNKKIIMQISFFIVLRSLFSLLLKASLVFV